MIILFNLYDSDLCVTLQTLRTCRCYVFICTHIQLHPFPNIISFLSKIGIETSKAFESIFHFRLLVLYNMREFNRIPFHRRTSNIQDVPSAAQTAAVMIA